MRAENYNISNVFISYSRRDSDFVKTLDQAFREQEMEVWVDYEDIPLSVDWWEEVKAGIEGADVMVFIISPDSVQSTVCRDEIDHALKNNKRFIPVLHRDVDPAVDMHPAVGSHNWLFFRDDDDFDTAFEKLLQTIHADFAYIRRHTRLLVRAREWDTNERDNGYLLRGSEFAEAEEWLAASADKEPEPLDLHSRYIYASAQARSQRQRLIIGGVSVALVVALGLALLSLLLFQESQRNLAISEQRGIELALQSTQISAQNRQINLGSRELQSISLALNAQQIFELGDAFRALPYAVAADEAMQTTLSEQAVSQITYSPGPERWLFQHTNAVNDIATSPVAPLAASASNDDTVRVWQVETGENIATLRRRVSNAERVAFSPDGAYLFSGNRSGLINIWDTTTWEPVGDLFDDGQLRGLIVRDGQVLTAAPDRVRLWSLGDDDGISATVRYTWEGDALPDAVTQVGFSPDGRTVVIGLDDGQLLRALIPATAADETPDDSDSTADDTPELVVMPVNHDDEITGIAFSADSSLMMTSAQERTIRVWNMETRRLLRTLDGHTNDVAAVAISPDGIHAVSVSFDRRLIHWNLNTGEALQVFTGHEGLPVSIAWTADGKWALSGSLNGGMIIWDFAVDRLLRQFELPSRIQGLEYDTSGERAVTASADGTIRIWDMNSGESSVLGTHGSEAFDVAFVLGDAYVVSAANDASDPLRLWNLDDGTYESLDGHSGSVYDLSINADGTRMLTGSFDTHVIYWNLQDRELIRRYDELSELRILTVALSPDDSTGFAASNLAVYHFDLSTGEIIKSYPGHTDSVISMAVSENGNWLATGDIRDTAVIWDVATGEQEHILQHDSAVWALDFDPSGTYLAAGTSRSQAVVWDTDSGDSVRVFQGNGDIGRGVVFRQDGRQLLFGEGHLHRISFLSTPQLIDWTKRNRIVYYFNCDERDEFRIEPGCRRTNRGRLPGNTQQATLQWGETHVWEYNGQAGDVLTIRVDAANPSDELRNPYKIRALDKLDTVVTLRTRSGDLLAQNNDKSSTSSDSQIDAVTLPATGSYRIEVSSFMGHSRGDYTLTITSQAE